MGIMIFEVVRNSLKDSRRKQPQADCWHDGKRWVIELDSLEDFQEFSDACGGFGMLVEFGETKSKITICD